MWVRVFALVLMGASVAGCTGYARPKPTFHEALTEAYRLDAGDKLRITVFGQTDLTNSYTVDQSGHISMPLIGGVPARGNTTADLEKSVADRLRNGFLRSPDVSVEVEQYRPFFIMGEVRNAGQYPYVANMTAQTAVAIAGGFTARAGQATVDITRQINGEIMTGRVPVTDPIRPGDTIYIRERLF
ncbi:MAG: polysaccharide export protein [Hyphomicrobiaceae bacterium]|nr:polysaccharide export protein [Hyphomicrobiaceae bacterium]